MLTCTFRICTRMCTSVATLAYRVVKWPHGLRVGRPRAMGQVLQKLSAKRQPSHTRAHSSTSLASNGWLIVGLGNPGARYDGTRHNVGFDLIHKLSKATGIDVNRKAEHALTGRGSLNGVPVCLVKPQTYMNLSGQSVGALARYYKIPADRVLVLVDDLDTPLGELRLRGKGSHAGHNGMRSVQGALGGSASFPRLRLGVGRPDDGTEIRDWVLQRFTTDQAVVVDGMLDEGVNAVRGLLTLGLARATSGCRVDADGRQYTAQGGHNKRKNVQRPAPGSSDKIKSARRDAGEA